MQHGAITKDVVAGVSALEDDLVSVEHTVEVVAADVASASAVVVVVAAAAASLAVDAPPAVAAFLDAVALIADIGLADIDSVATLDAIRSREQDLVAGTPCYAGGLLSAHPEREQ